MDRDRLHILLNYVGLLFLMVAGWFFITATDKFFVWLTWFVGLIYDHRIETGWVVFVIGVVLITTSYIVKKVRRNPAS